METPERHVTYYVDNEPGRPSLDVPCDGKTHLVVGVFTSGRGGELVVDLAPAAP